MEHVSFDPELGYCQGMNYIAAVIAERTKDVAAATARFRRIVDALRGIWLPGFPFLVVGMSAFDAVLRTCEPALHQHLQANDVSFDMFLPDVWLTLFSRWLPFPILWDVLDYVEAEGFVGVLGLTVAVMKLHSSELLEAADFTALFVTMKSLGQRAKQPELPAVLGAARGCLPVVREVLPEGQMALEANGRDRACSVVRHMSRVLHAGTDLEVVVYDGSQATARQLARQIEEARLARGSAGSKPNSTPDGAGPRQVDLLPDTRHAKPASRPFWPVRWLSCCQAPTIDEHAETLG